MIKLSREEQEKKIEAWIKTKGELKRYSHGERPAGSKPVNISVWGHKTKNEAEEQAARDSEQKRNGREIMLELFIGLAKAALFAVGVTLALYAFLLYALLGTAFLTDIFEKKEKK